MSRRPRIFIDLIIIPALHTLVPEKVNRLVLHPGQSFARICLRLNMLQTIRLIPAGGEDIEGDLTSNAVAV